MRIFIRVFFMVGWVSSFLFGEDFARFPGSFLRMGTTARTVSLGSALTADSHFGLTGVYNPAGPAFMNQKHGTIGYQHLSLDRRLSSVGMTMKLPPTAGVGIAYIHAGVDHIEERNSLGEYSGRLSTGEHAFILSFAQNFNGRLGFGLNVKILAHTLPIYNEKLKGTGVGVDLGFLYQINEFIHFGGVVQNLNTKYKWKTNVIFEEVGTLNYDEFPVIYKTGIKTIFEKIHLFCETEFITHNSFLLGKRLKGGLEYFLDDRLTLRSGFGGNQFGIGFGYTFVTVGIGMVTLDYSAGVDGVQKFNGVSHIFTSSISL